MSQRVSDRRVLDLVRRMLKAAVVMPDGTRVAVEEGTPQGGPLSPFLSNIVLDEFDQELARRGLRFVRYADDANVFVRSERAGIRVMASLRQFLERRLRLQINEEKSAVRRPEQVHFLGFRFRCTDGGVPTTIGITLSDKAKRAVVTTIREMTPPNWGRSITSCMADLSRYLNGWMAHYRLCTLEAAPELGVIDAMFAVGSGQSSCARRSGHASCSDISCPARSAARPPPGPRIAARGVGQNRTGRP